MGDVISLMYNSAIIKMCFENWRVVKGVVIQRGERSEQLCWEHVLYSLDVGKLTSIDHNLKIWSVSEQQIHLCKNFPPVSEKWEKSQSDAPQTLVQSNIQPNKQNTRQIKEKGARLLL